MTYEIIKKYIKCNQVKLSGNIITLKDKKFLKTNKKLNILNVLSATKNTITMDFGFLHVLKKNKIIIDLSNYNFKYYDSLINLIRKINKS